MNVTVVGLGAMGGGMARAILRSDKVAKVTGFDLSLELASGFYEEAKAAGKAAESLPEERVLKNFVSQETDVVVLVLVNEEQCDFTCFGSEEGNNLETLLRTGACVFLGSTVGATWAKYADERFAKKDLLFVDCPISGGPVRAHEGILTLMPSGDDKALELVDPILKACGKEGEIYTVPGGSGMGQTIKMCHQICAGSHIVVAAEALSLAARAGLDVDQFYNLVKGAGGTSWMFGDRGKRMIEPTEKCMSAIDIWLKDLNIVQQEARKLKSPTPIVSTVLQQYISAAGLGLGREDDSCVVRVYETLNGVSVARPGGVKKEGAQVGDVWSGQEILDVGDEPRHHVMIKNEYTRAILVEFPPGDTTRPHAHLVDSLYFCLLEGGHDVINHIHGCDPKPDRMEYGEVRFGEHIENPLIHKITNKSQKSMFVVDAEVLKTPPVTCADPLVADHHELIKTRDKARVYKLSLNPGETVSVSYPFFYLTIVQKGSNVRTEVAPGVGWETNMQSGDMEWKSPTVNLSITNTGEGLFEQFIAEWR